MSAYGPVGPGQWGPPLGDSAVEALERGLDVARLRALKHGAVAVACVLRTVFDGDEAAALEALRQALAVDPRAVGDVRDVLTLNESALTRRTAGFSKEEMP